MSRELFKKRKYEFIEFIMKEQRLPKVWEFHFTDGEDMRLWFNKLYKLKEYKDLMNEINIVLNKYNIKVLNDAEREQEFLTCISQINHIPRYNEVYFFDNIDMHMWYMNYRKNNLGFETIVHNNLKEYQELDLANIWTLIKQEFIYILKELKRVPNHGEVILQNEIDVRTIYDKLESFDPIFFEKLLLHLQTYNKKGLSIDDRINQLKNVISSLGYIPTLQEFRFSDGTDMFTWYTRYKDKLPNLEKEINSLIYRESPHKKVNIYLIPKFRKTGGKFYTICTNIGERLDLSNIDSFEDALKLDDTFTKRGGVILRKDEEIESVSFKKGKAK